jgi:hypothetical protein
MRSRLLEFLELSVDPMTVYRPEDPVEPQDEQEPAGQYSPNIPQPNKALQPERLDKMGDINIDRDMPGNDMQKQKRHWNFMAENLRQKYPDLGGKRGVQL